MKSKGMAVKNTAILYVSDEFVSKAVGTQLMPAVFGKHNVALAGEPLGFPTAAFDLSPQVAQLMQDPTETVAVAGIVEATVKAAKELRRQGHQGPHHQLGHLRRPGPGPLKIGPEGNGTLYAAWFWWDRDERSRAFTEKFNAENANRGIEKAGPHHVDASAYDIVYILKTALEQIGATGDADKLKPPSAAALRDALTVRSLRTA